MNYIVVAFQPSVGFLVSSRSSFLSSPCFPQTHHRHGRNVCRIAPKKTTTYMRGSRLPLPYDSRFSRSRSRLNNNKSAQQPVPQPEPQPPAEQEPAEDAESEPTASEQEDQAPSSTAVTTPETETVTDIDESDTASEQEDQAPSSAAVTTPETETVTDIDESDTASEQEDQAPSSAAVTTPETETVTDIDESDTASEQEDQAPSSAAVTTPETETVTDIDESDTASEQEDQAPSSAAVTTPETETVTDIDESEIVEDLKSQTSASQSESENEIDTDSSINNTAVNTSTATATVTATTDDDTSSVLSASIGLDASNGADTGSNGNMNGGNTDTAGGSLSPKDLPSVKAMESEAPSFDDSDDGHSGNDGNDDSNNNNNDKGGGDDDEDDSSDERSELIRSLKINEHDAETVTLSELRQLDAATKLPALGWLASRWPALRERLGANPRLTLQLGVELCVGVGTKTLAEIQGRGERFWKEFDFYLSDIALEIFGDAILVWLLSPVVRTSISAIPKHFGQIGAFSPTSRLAALFVKGFQFGLAGFISSVIGHSLTRYLVSLRDAKNAQNANNPDVSNEQVVLAPVLQTSLAWGSFMAVSSNVRYQLVNGIEQRVLDPIFGQYLPILTAVTFALRLSNCYVGSLHWLPWAKLWDLQ